MNRRDFIKAGVLASIGAAIAPKMLAEALEGNSATVITQADLHNELGMWRDGVIEFSGKEVSIKEMVELINSSVEWDATDMRTW